ncbi:MAG: hypothetical protein SGILL_007118, partial [Bacillariaceae sp.]
VVEIIWKTEICGEEEDQEGQTYQNKLEAVVDLIYYYTGGRIRDAIKIVKGADTIEGFAQYLNDFVKDVPQEGIELATSRMYGTKAVASFDTLRTYFKEKGGDGHIQIVDSAYALSLLDNLGIETKCLDSYTEAIK